MALGALPCVAALVPMLATAVSAASAYTATDHSMMPGQPEKFGFFNKPQRAKKHNHDINILKHNVTFVFSNSTAQSPSVCQGTLTCFCLWGSLLKALDLQVDQCSDSINGTTGPESIPQKSLSYLHRERRKDV